MKILSFFLASLLSRSSLADDTLDNTDSNSLTHVTNGETSKRRISGELLNAHGLLGNHGNHGGVSRLDELGVVFERLSSTSVDLGGDFLELAGNVSSVAIENWCISSSDLSRVVQNDNLGRERLSSSRGIVLGVSGNESTTDILDGNVLDVESDVVSRGGLGELLVMHFDGLDFRGDLGGSKSNGVSRAENSSFNTSDGNRPYSSDFVNVLEGETERLVDGSLGGLEGIEGFEERGSLVPREVGRLLEHVVSVPSRDGDKLDLVEGVSDLLQIIRNFLLDFRETSLGPVDRLVVHLVDANDHLTNSEGEGEESVLSGLSFLGDTSFELTLT
jgi:hypothetical protein